MYRSAGLRRLLLASCVLLCSAAAAAQDDFTIIVLPDTQFYSQNHPQIFAAQTRWIAGNASARNVRFVLGVGDIVNNGSEEAQWRNADAAIRTLDDAGVDYALPVGNHDYRYSKPSLRVAPLFNKYFGPQRYAGKSYYRGQYPAGSNENFYVTFDAAGRKYLVLLLEFYPRRAALDWAESVIAQFPDRKSSSPLTGIYSPTPPASIAATTTTPRPSASAPTTTARNSGASSSRSRTASFWC